MNYLSFKGSTFSSLSICIYISRSLINMSLYTLRYCFYWVLLLLAIPAYSQLLEEPQSVPAIDTVPKDIEQAILNRLQGARPDLAFTDVELSPIEGIYKVKINGQVSFVSANGEFLIAGEMYQLQGNRLVNLQEREREEASIAFEPERAKMLAAVSQDDMVIFKPSEPAKAYVHVFTDIDCGFCRRLHSQIEEFLELGIEVRYLAFPRAGTQSRSAQKLATVWCSEKANDLMTQFKKGQNVPLSPCDTSPVGEQYLLGQQVGVTGTPSIILPSGKIVPGAVSPQYLARLLEI